ncbi:MAG: hypothetical protein JWN30_1416 [Bacilli bacterium]|nr:hypothetical protein [Bacilli bacterium]
MRVAVEDNLSPVSDYLKNQGYQVDSLDDANLGAANSDYSAVVISGADQNVMGIQNVAINCPVINAEGLTPTEIHERIEQSARFQ